MAFRITKSLYMAYCQCPKRFYLEAFYPHLKTQDSRTIEYFSSQGQQIHLLARQLFPDGVEVTNIDTSLAFKETRTKFYRNKKVLFEPAFYSKHGQLELVVRNDVLRLNSKEDVEIYEVKSSTKVKSEYIQDLAFQVYVLWKAGFRASKAQLILLNEDYKRESSLSPSSLFKVVDLTKEVFEELDIIEDRLQNIIEIVQQDENPHIHPGSYCQKPHECPFKTQVCWPKEHTTLNLRKTPLKYSLYLNGDHSLKDLSTETTQGLPDYCKKQIESEKSGKLLYDRNEIQKILSTLSPNHCYLDFETISPGLPLFKNTSPYQVIPFQAHIALFNPEEGIKDFSFIEFPKEGSADPGKSLAKFLINNIKPNSNIVVYYAPFERNVLLNLALKYPQYKNQLQSIANRLWDLHEIFSQGLFIHPDFKGSTSIKEVAPILSPSHSYKECRITNGMEASIQYIELILGKIPSHAYQQSTDDLIKYCREDVLAMVEIIKNLRRLK